MKLLRYKKNGFTLIEVITSLVILSIISLIAGMGMVSITKGYVFTRKNADTAQKGQMVIARIVKELGATNAISSGTATSITFNSKSPPEQQRMLSWNNIDKTLSIGSVSDVMTDNVSSFSLSYYRFYDDTSPSAIYVSNSTALIQITIGLKGANDVVTTFVNRVFLSKMMGV